MLNVRIKVRLRFFGAHCPSCEGANLRPGVIRPWVENAFLRTWLFLSYRRPYLCRDCDTRFYDFRFKARHMTDVEPEIESMLKDYEIARLAQKLRAPEPQPEVQPTVTPQTAEDKEGRTA